MTAILRPAIAFLLFLPASAHAACGAPGPATFSERTVGGDNTHGASDDLPETVEIDVAEANGTAVGRMATTASRPAQSDVELETTGSLSVSASASIRWQAVVSGPDGVIPVRAHFVGGSSIFGAAQAYAESRISLDDIGRPGQVVADATSHTNDFTRSYEYDTWVDRTLTVSGGCVLLWFEANAGVYTLGEGGGQAIADPELVLDPSIASDYTVTWSGNLEEPVSGHTGAPVHTGLPEEPTTGTDTAAPADTSEATDDGRADPKAEAGGCSCASRGPSAAAAAGLVALALARRRRR